MTRLTWDTVGERFYETGVDRGVLFVSNVGYAWNGLVSVDENPSGGEAKAFYLDGVKYLEVAGKEEFQATISAFYSPPEFDVCDGSGLIEAGLFATQQRRQPFGLSYRTKIANDVDGVDHAYKIHIVYNALAVPANRLYASINDSAEATPLSWALTTTPNIISGVAPSAHLIIDTTTADAGAVSDIEDLLYGTVSLAPALPTPAAIVALFP